jgi:short-subunit dehydrogenase
MTTHARRNMLITGAGSGLGKAFTTEALSSGHSVVGTVRSEAARLAFDAMHPVRAQALLLDLTDFVAIGPAVAKLDSEAGPIDVLVNNAGYGQEGILEESPLEEIKRQFDVNVFGAVAIMKAVLPYMRERRRGHIVNITSMAGYVGLPGIAYYAGSKLAVECIFEALAKEVRHLGIRVTAIAPGSFRTDWAGFGARGA